MREHLFDKTFTMNDIFRDLAVLYDMKFNYLNDLDEAKCNIKASTLQVQLCYIDREISILKEKEKSFIHANARANYKP